MNWYFKLKNLEAMRLFVPYSPDLKLLPACLTGQFSGQLEDWIFILTSHSQNVQIYYLEERTQLGSLCLFFKTSRRHVVLSVWFNVSCEYLFSCNPLWFHTGSFKVENSSYATWICFVQWLLISLLLWSVMSSETRQASVLSSWCSCFILSGESGSL